MSVYDMFGTNNENGERNYDQVKAFHCEMKSYDIGDRVNLEGLENLMNCDIATPEGHILKIRNGIYTGWIQVEYTEINFIKDGVRGYKFERGTYKSEHNIPLIDKYGVNI